MPITKNLIAPRPVNESRTDSHVPLHCTNQVSVDAVIAEVGSGAVTWLLVSVVGSFAVKPGVDFEEPAAMLIGPFIYAFLANICYTFGWIVDTISYHGVPRTRLYKAGIIFSLILTILPGIWAVVAWLMTVITGHKLG
ncbi:MAG TPA: hypothetical protein VMH89_03510 [Candidatus Acidoferrum sp.]|nr:hypothetical protein [Candidatus Acidoferrum sp.]